MQREGNQQVGKKLKSVKKAGNLESQDGTAEDKTSGIQIVKNVTLGSVTYGGFHFGQMMAN